MILLFQINPSASESALAVDHMRSFFECVLRDYYHHDVRTISAMMLERIADARQQVDPTRTLTQTLPRP